MVDEKTEDKEAPHRVRPFADFLQEHRHGLLHDELGFSLQSLVAAVQTVGKPGKLTLTITVKPAARGAENVLVADQVSVAEPVSDRPEAIYFVDDEANLSRKDPRQQELPIVRPVEVGG